jgi:ubiquinone/menaquinone biosynthesis C-methylase UbiE
LNNEKTKTEEYGELFTSGHHADLWNDLYRDTDNPFNHNMAIRRDRVVQFVAGHCKPTDKILDLGCGAGVVSEKLIEAGYTVCAVDRSQDMLEHTRKRLSRLPQERYELKQGTCESVPYPDNYFDTILCVGVFGYIDDVVGALLEIRRVLRPGGTVLISVRNSYNRVFSDPVRTLRFFGGKAAGMFRARPRPATAAAAMPAGPDGKPRPAQFRVDIQQNPFPFIRGVETCGYRLVDFTGFGFGPFSVAGKYPFSHRWSIRISDFLNKTFDGAGLKVITRTVGDVSIYIFRKTDA